MATSASGISEPRLEWPEWGRFRLSVIGTIAAVPAARLPPDSCRSATSRRCTLATSPSTRPALQQTKSVEAETRTAVPDVRHIDIRDAEHAQGGAAEVSD